MEQEVKKLQGELFSRGLSTDLATEFDLPDYQPEIKRLLRVRAVPLSVDQYVGGSSVELSGAVEFQALYAAEDDSLWCVTKREDYRLSCPFEAGSEFDLSEGPVCDMTTEAENVSGRVLAPRKLSARCRIRTQVRMLADRSGADLSPAEAPEIERLPGSISASRVRLGRSAPVTLTDEILLDPSQPPVRVISASGTVFPTEVQAGTGLVACRGEVLLALLCAAEQAPSLEDATDCIPASATPTELLRKIPFAVEVPVDGATDACACNAWGNCTEIAVTVEDARILCDVTLVLTARAVCREEIPFTRDAYSTARFGEPVFRSLPVEQSLVCRNGNCSVSATKELAELGIKPEAQVLEADAEATLLPPELAHGKYVLPGTVRFRVLTQQPGGDCALCELETPFRFETTAESDTPPTISRSVATPTRVKASLDGNRMLAETELSVALDLATATDVTTLSDLQLGDPLPAPAPATCRICYPAAGDSLWSVAAKYHVPVGSLQQKNKTLPTTSAPDSPTSLKEIHYLLL